MMISNLLFGQNPFSIEINNKVVFDTFKCNFGKNNIEIKIENNDIKNLKIKEAKIILARNKINLKYYESRYIFLSDQKSNKIAFNFDSPIAEQWLYVIISYQNLARPTDTLLYSKVITISANLDHYPKPYCLEVLFYDDDYELVFPFQEFINVSRGRKWLDVIIEQGDTLPSFLSVEEKIAIEEMRELPINIHFRKLLDKGRTFADSIVENQYYFNEIIDDSVSVAVQYKGFEEEFTLPKNFFLCGGKLQLGMFKNSQKLQKKYAKYLKKLPEKDSKEGLILTQTMPYLWSLKHENFRYNSKKHLWISYTSFLNPNAKKTSKILPLKKIKKLKWD